MAGLAGPWAPWRERERSLFLATIGVRRERPCACRATGRHEPVSPPRLAKDEPPGHDVPPLWGESSESACPWAPERALERAVRSFAAAGPPLPLPGPRRLPAAESHIPSRCPSQSAPGVTESLPCGSGRGQSPALAPHARPKKPRWAPLPLSSTSPPLTLSLLSPSLHFQQPSHKTFRIKRVLAKKQKQNRPIPQWIRFRTDNTVRYNSKRRHWRRTKLGL